MNKDSAIYIAGHRGMVGSAIWRILYNNGYTNLIGKSSSELDLRNQSEVNVFFKSNNIDVVIDAAARVGGIFANNKYPYQFLMDNMLIQNNLINSAFESGVEKKDDRLCLQSLLLLLLLLLLLVWTTAVCLILCSTIKI